MERVGSNLTRGSIAFHKSKKPAQWRVRFEKLTMQILHINQLHNLIFIHQLYVCY